MKHRPLISASRSLVCQLLLALALLVAQTAAQAHVYSHLGGGPDKVDSTGAAGQLCSECLSSAPLLSAAGSPTSPCIGLVADVAEKITAIPVPRFAISRHYAFRSRAPPALP